MKKAMKRALLLALAVAMLVCLSACGKCAWKIKINGKDIQIPCTLDDIGEEYEYTCLLYTSPSPRDRSLSRMPSSA